MYLLCAKTWSYVYYCLLLLTHLFQPVHEIGTWLIPQVQKPPLITNVDISSITRTAFSFTSILWLYKQRRPWRVCAFEQAHQGIRCSKYDKFQPRMCWLVLFSDAPGLIDRLLQTIAGKCIFKHSLIPTKGSACSRGEIAFRFQKKLREFQLRS